MARHKVGENQVDNECGGPEENVEESGNWVPERGEGIEASTGYYA